MALINLPEPIYRRMELIPEPRRVKGGAPIPKVSSWVDLAEPQHVPLSSSSIDDKELDQFLAANDGSYRYDYVRLCCSFGPQNGERFEKAYIMVDLKPDGPKPPSLPISWSIFPLNEYDPVEESVSTKIGGTGKFLSAEIGSSSKIVKKLYSLRGYREGASNPYWELFNNEATSLNGSLRFHMVVRSAVAFPTLGHVRLEAVISQRSFVVFCEKRPFDQSPSVEFQLRAH